MWPSDDPFVGAEWGQRYADALGGDTRLEMTSAPATGLLKA
jgi:hypothetical protein